MRKPQPEFFLLAAQRLNVHPQEALFLDDDSRFIEGALAIGMVAIQFKNSQQAITEIQNYIDVHK